MKLCYTVLSYTTGHGALFVSSAAGSTNDCWGKHPVLLDSRPAGCVATAAGSTGCFTMTAKDGKPCKRCGTSEWYKTGECADCARKRKLRWQAANRERDYESTRRWRANNPEKVREQKRRWGAKNPEKVREYNRRRRQANLEIVRRQGREASRRYRAANLEKVRESSRCWLKANPEKVSANTHRRRARIKGNGGSYTAAEWNEVVRQQGGHCLACGKRTELTVDHVLPLVMGGTNDIENIQGLCFSCNASKGARHIDYRPGGKGIKRWIQRRLFNE